MQVDALASGSSGNAYLLRTGLTAILLEAGLPASKLARFVEERGCDPARLDGILLTHAHSDHLQGARDLSDRLQVPIYATPGTLGHPELRESELARAVQANRTFQLGDLEVLPFRVPHDCVEPVGFRISAEQRTFCLATDLGFVPDSLTPLFERSDLLVLEANHDDLMLQDGPYPDFLKRRVGGSRGHLSNRAAAACLAGLAARPPGEVWLAHLSVVNNRVARALDAIGQALKGVGLAHVPVAVAARNNPSLRWQADAPSHPSGSEAPRQLSLF